MVELGSLLGTAGQAAEVLSQATGLAIYARSIASDRGSLFFLGKGPDGRQLSVLARAQPEPGFTLTWRAVTLGGERALLGVGRADHANAVVLRERLPFTAPVVVGVRRSAGFGDRLGLATPGHIRALRTVRGVFPVLAQQSMREMERTRRTPAEVLDAVTWGAFQEGWRGGYGADADHLKAEADIDACAAAGYTMYTLDPREHVDALAEGDAFGTLLRKYEALPWERLATTPEAMRAVYVGRSWSLGEGCCITFDEGRLLGAACKYGRALAHLAALARRLQWAMAGRPYEVEISVDETDAPTTPEEHFFIAAELKRLGVAWVSLAPRYGGRFEKGVDYIGDLARFEADFRAHVAVARAMGPYKLSLHSGSDKFSIYPIVARLAGDLVHLKTAGTSYLEALRAVASFAPALFRAILRFALAHYEQDRASYYVSAELARVPEAGSVPDGALDALMDSPDVRQVLHVTFGSVLTADDAQGAPLFRGRLFAALEAGEEAHYAALEAHLARHLAPFSH